MIRRPDEHCKLRSRLVGGGRGYRLGSLARGFTLIELMVGIVLLAVLLSIALPSYRSFILDQRLRAISTDLRIALMTARSEAVKRNRNVTLKPDADDGWGAGWFIESPNAGEPIILKHAQTGNNITITGPTDPPQFTPSGRVRGQTDIAEATDFNISIGPSGSNIQSCLVIGLDGRVSSSKGACS